MKLSYVYNKIRFFFTKNGYSRGDFLRNKNLLKGIGENVFFQPRKLPGDPSLIKMHNNVVVAAGVTFINHDVMNILFNYIEEGSAAFEIGCIEVMDNVFIGANSIILPNVRIGENSIVAAGSVVTKDVPPGSIVGGVPAKVIGDFTDLRNKRKIEAELRNGRPWGHFIDQKWEDFFESRDAELERNGERMLERSGQ